MVTDSQNDHTHKAESKASSCRAITLTTDFGTNDEYVAVMKGVILSRLVAPTAVHLVDISHDLQAQDIHSASFVIGRAYRYFPAGTVNLVVVDPGVGSKRRIIAIESGQQFFIGPDNGVFTAVLRNAENAPDPAHAYEVTNSRLFLPNISSTFHGRDIMAPVAASLASGLPISMVGKEIAVTSCTTLPQQPKKVGTDSISGAVTHIDRFGNLCTNLTADDLQPLIEKGSIEITIGNTTINGLSDSYSAAANGSLLAHFDSHFHLEIAVCEGSAANLLKSQVGDRVYITISDIG